MSKPLIYVASPYTHLLPGVRLFRFEQVCYYAGELMNEGKVVFSPIAHCHPIQAMHNLPCDWEYWQKTCEAYLSCCYKLIVLQLDGWDTSVGVQAEIKLASALGLEIEYVKPYWSIK
jgi:hypothetical protein